MLKLRPPDAFFDFFDQLRADGFCGGRGPEVCASRSAYTPDAGVGTLGEDRQAQQKGDGWMDVSGRFNVFKFLSQHPGRELTIWAFAENDSTTEFNMIYLLAGDQKHASDDDSQLSRARAMRLPIWWFGETGPGVRCEGEVTASVAWHPRVWSCCAAERQCHLSCGERCVAGRGRAMMRRA